MKPSYRMLPALLAVLALGSAVAEASSLALPLAFEPNVGQTDARVRFLARGPAGTLFLTGSEAVLALRSPRGALRIAFQGASSGRAEMLESMPGVTNYYQGDDPARWHPRVPHAGRVRFAGIYPGIDAVWYGSEGSPEMDFVVAPGADPAAIVLSFAGTRSVQVGESGDLILALAGGELALRRPAAYQEVDGVRREVAASYRVRDGQAAFELGAYDATQPLVVDPLVVWSSFLGGSDSDAATSVAVGPGGDTYVTGTTSSPDFPGDNLGDQPAAGAVFVTRIDAEGRRIEFTTLLDGRSSDASGAIAVDDAGSSYVTGQTTSANFPLVEPFQPTFNPGPSGWLTRIDSFVAKLDPDGAIVFSTYLGGERFEIGTGIAVDGAHRVYAVGGTSSGFFPVRGEFQDHRYFSEEDAYLTVYTADGQDLVYSTLLGGQDGDEAKAVTVDLQGNAYLTGKSSSTDFPMRSGAQSANAGGEDAWVAKINPSASGDASLVYSTYLGGSGADRGNGIAVDAGGQAHVTGNTDSASFPLVAPPGRSVVDGTRAGQEAFVAKLSASGNAILFSTFLGGEGTDSGTSIALDGAGAAYVTGGTDSESFLVRHAFQAELRGKSDAFVAKLDPAASRLLWSSFLGGLDSESGFGVALDPRGRVALAGETLSGATFPRRLALQDTFGGGEDDGYVALLEATAASTVGVFRAGESRAFLRNSNTAGGADLTVTLGQPGDLPIAGSWLGVGSRPGVFRQGAFILKAFNNDLVCCNISFAFGQTNDLPLAGDWNGDGVDTVGVVTGGFLFQLRNSNSAGAADLTFAFGVAGDVPLAGDWDGDGVDTIGVFRPSTGEFFLRNSNDAGAADVTVTGFGQAGDVPVVGDWDGDGLTTIGVYRAPRFFLRNSNSAGAADLVFRFGATGDLPIAGDWDGRP